MEPSSATVGSPSRWLRARSKVKLGLTAIDGWTGKTLAEERQIKQYNEDLKSRDVDLRLKAATQLGTFAAGDRLAEAVAEDLKQLLECLNPRESQSVRLAVLGTLRGLAEKKQAFRVSMHTYAVVPLLTDEDPAIQRKAASLFRVLAEEGAASTVARFVPSIMSGFEASQRNGNPLLAPLDALTAIAEAGEAAASAQVIERLVATLQDSHPKIRISTCSTLAAIARAGRKDLLKHLGLTCVTRISDLEPEPTLFELLVTVALDDLDQTVRVAAAEALRCLPEADPNEISDAERHSLPLINRVRSLVGEHHGEVKEILNTVFGLEEGEACVICQRGIHLLGGPEMLPCGHCFHGNCIKEWFAWKTKCGHTRTCPLCRWTQGPLPPIQAGRRATVS